MRVSVVTICFNSKDTILATLKSVHSQFSNCEVEHVIVDGGSRDGTIDIIEAFRADKSNIVFVSEPDEGIYDAMNKGLKLASGEIFGILNSDDYFTDQFCLEAITAPIRLGRAEITYGDVDYVERFQPDKIVRRWKSGSFSRGTLRWGWHPPHPTFYVHRKVYEQVGKFNKNLKIAADYELMLRCMSKEAFRVEYVPQILVKMRRGGVSNASYANILKANFECYKAFAINGQRIPYLLGPAKIVRKMLQYV